MVVVVKITVEDFLSFEIPQQVITTRKKINTRKGKFLKNTVVSIYKEQ